MQLEGITLPVWGENVSEINQYNLQFMDNTS